MNFEIVWSTCGSKARTPLGVKVEEICRFKLVARASSVMEMKEAAS